MAIPSWKGIESACMKKARFAVWGGRMNLQKQVEPLYQPRFRLPRAEACTPRDVAILLGL